MSFKPTGHRSFTIAGQLYEKPQMQSTQNGFKFCEIVLEVNEYNTQKKENTQMFIPITVYDRTAESLCGNYGPQVGEFFTVVGTVKSSQIQSKDGKYFDKVQLIGTKVLRGVSGGDGGGGNNNQGRRG